MKLLGVVTLLVAAVAQLAAAAGSAHSEAKTPIARVVSLLQGLQGKLEADLKSETEVWENYRCWAKSIIDGKTASNQLAQSRIDSLNAYIEDIDAGRIEFTTERQDLEKQVATLTEELKQAADIRDQENADFEAAKAEMEKAIAALDEAILAMQAGMSTNFLRRLHSARMLSVRWGLKKALEFGKDTLSAGDSKLIEDMLHGDTPNPDWKKLNRKATFKMKYKAASGDIVKTLQKLNTTFTDNLADAEAKEAAAVESYNKLKGSKETMLGTAQTALIDMVEENGARGLSRGEAQTEVDALTQQVTDDTRFISETETSFNTKKGEWEERERLRNVEISGISQAIAVLHSDEARDAFTKSYSSASFLQEASVSSRKTTTEALKALRALATRTKDARLSGIAKLAMQSGTKSIANVITAIDGLIASLEAEEGTDLTNKEDCETQLATTAQEARMTSLAIDDLTDDMGRAEEKIEEVKAQIKEEEESIVEMNTTLMELIRQREDEHTRYESDKADDLMAVQLIGQAQQVIADMHTNFSLSSVSVAVRNGAAPKAAAVPASTGLTAVTAKLHHASAGAAATAQSSAAVAQQKAKATVKVAAKGAAKQPVEVEAGMAPPPPPTTWENPAYEGASGETGGIASILSLLKDDMQADITAADKEEADAVTAFDAAKKDLDDAIIAAQDAISGYENDKATHEQTVVDKGTERTGKRGELDATMKEIEGLKPGCDFLLVNYAVRTKARQIEIDGLKEAKAILQGANFS